MFYSSKQYSEHRKEITMNEWIWNNNREKKLKDPTEG